MQPAPNIDRFQDFLDKTGDIGTVTNKNILVFTNLGNVFKVDVNGLPISKWKEKGI